MKNKVFPISMTVLWGMVFGSAMHSLTMGICMTGGIFMTQFYGARNREGMGQAFRYKLIMGLAAFVPYYLVCMTFPRQVLSLMLVGNSQAGPILDEAVKYIRIMFFTGIPVTISISIASSLRDIGKVRIPLYVTIAATLTNTILNWLLIYGHLGFPKMGVEGAALATVIARALELTIFVVIYIRTKPEFAVKAADFLKINRIQFRETLVKGFLVLFCEMVWALSETITTAVYNGRGGADVVSGMASGFAIANLFFVAFGGDLFRDWCGYRENTGCRGTGKSQGRKNLAAVRSLSCSVL